MGANKSSLHARVFSKHTVAELRGWADYDLEQQGRLTHPLRYDAGADKYVECSWEEAFKGIGAELNALDPKSWCSIPPAGRV